MGCHHVLITMTHVAKIRICTCRYKVIKRPYLGDNLPFRASAERIQINLFSGPGKDHMTTLI